MKEEAMNLKKTGYGYMEGFGGEKKEKCDYIIISKIN